MCWTRPVCWTSYHRPTHPKASLPEDCYLRRLNRKSCRSWGDSFEWAWERFERERWLRQDRNHTAWRRMWICSAGGHPPYRNLLSAPTSWWCCALTSWKDWTPWAEECLSELHSAWIPASMNGSETEYPSFQTVCSKRAPLRFFPENVYKDNINNGTFLFKDPTANLP